LRWGGPDGGAGDFITGDKEGRCAQWPPAGYGEPTDTTTQRSLQVRSNQVADPSMKDAEFPGLARDTPPGHWYYRHEPASARVARKPERDA